VRPQVGFSIHIGEEKNDIVDSWVDKWFLKIHTIKEK
jgi:hypothetical protein